MSERRDRFDLELALIDADGVAHTLRKLAEGALKSDDHLGEALMYLANQLERHLDGAHGAMREALGLN